MNSDAGEELVKKVFKKKFKEIEDRESYAGDFGDEFWRSWPRKEMPTKAEHWISKEKLLGLAKMLNYNSWKLKALVKWLDEGAAISCYSSHNLSNVRTLELRLTINIIDLARENPIVN